MKMRARILPDLSQLPNDPESLKLVRDAITQGFLRLDRNGQVRRATEPKAEGARPQPEAASVQSLMKFGLDPIVPLKDAAALLGCHPDTIRNREREGKIKILRMSPRRLGVHVSEIRRFMAVCAEARAEYYQLPEGLQA